MKNSWNWPIIVSLLFYGIELSLMTGCAWARDHYQTDAHSATAVEPVFDVENRSSNTGREMLQRFRKNGELRLTLNDCIRIALERNPDIRLANETLAQAEADITKAWSSMLPFLGAEGFYTRLDEELAFSLGPSSLTFMDRNTYKAGIVVRQPLYMGGRLNAARKAAQYSSDARIQDKRSVEQEIIFRVTRGYHTTQVAGAFHKVAVEAVHLLEIHEHDVAILVREGANPELDLLRTRTELANARKELNAAANALDLSLSALKNLLVIDLEEALSFTERLDRPPRPTGALPTLTRLAISQRPELSSLKSQVAAAEQGLKAAKGEYHPSIALESRYEYIQGDFRELDGDYHWTIGIGAQVPVWNWGETRAKVRKAGSQLEQTRIRLEKTEDRIQLEVREAFLNLGKAEKNIAAAEVALETAKEAFRLARASYQAGEGTNTDVLDARAALSRAEANHVQALFEYNVALAALQRAMGMGESSKLPPPPIPLPRGEGDFMDRN